MGNIHHPRRGSLQFWPRKRARHSLARIRSWPVTSKIKPLGFIGYKAGMARVEIIDNQPKSLTKGEKIILPVTVIDCPPLTVAGVVFYQNQQKATFLAEKLSPELRRKIPFPKKKIKGWGERPEFEDLRLLVHSNPKFLPVGAKKPKLLEIALGGSNEEKLNYAQKVLGQEIKVADVFSQENLADVHGITKGKGFQGTVKRYGVPIRQHKAEKTKRGIGSLGPWQPRRVAFSVAQPGKMGYHLRTEFNKRIIKIGSDGQEITPRGGVMRYGQFHRSYLLLKGSVVGPKKRAIVLTLPQRPDLGIPKEAPEVTYFAV